MGDFFVSFCLDFCVTFFKCVAISSEFHGIQTAAVQRPGPQYVHQGQCPVTPLGFLPSGFNFRTQLRVHPGMGEVVRDCEREGGERRPSFPSSEDCEHRPFHPSEERFRGCQNYQESLGWSDKIPNVGSKGSIPQQQPEGWVRTVVLNLKTSKFLEGNF